MSPEPPHRPSEIAKLDYEASITEAADRLRFQQEIGLTACKSVILVNGGAIIGLLSFIGNQAHLAHPNQLKGAVIGFCIGIAFGLFSLYFGYIGQEWLSNFRVSAAWNYQQDMMQQPRIHDADRERKSGWHLMLVASALVMAGIGMFIYGAITAASAILG
jgi:hypothetical protein